MKKAIKEFIIKEHANACSEWKARWEERYPELFKPEIEVGKWYKRDKFPNTMIFVLGYEDGIYKGYGINGDGRWESDYKMGLYFSSVTPAAKEEVETALKSHFEKIYLGGRVESLVCKQLNEIVEKKIIEKYCQYMYTDNSLNYFGMTVFKDGVWAKIIEEEKPELKIESIESEYKKEREKAEFRFKVDKMQAELEKLKNQFENLLK